MVPALLLSFILTQSPAAGVAGAPSDDPAATGELTPGAKSEPQPVLKGLDLGFTVFNSTGTYFGAEGYTNTFTFWFEPSFALGARLFKGTWLEKLSIAARLPLEVELAGNDPRFRGTGFTSAALYVPEALPIVDSQPGAVDGPASRGAILGDLWLSLIHGHLFTIPALNIDVSSSLRAALPTSIGSRNAGLIASLGLGVIFEKKFFDRFSLGYVVRPTKYFYTRTAGAIAPLGTTVTINGNPEPTWTPSSTGTPNPTFGLINGFWAALELPKGFGVSVNYFLFNTKPYDLTGGCHPIDQPGVDTCADGLAVSPSITRTPWRNEHWFLASVDYHHSFWALSLGISTFRQLEATNNRSSTNPVWESNRNNYTTLYLSFSATAEGVAGFVTGKPEEHHP